MCPRNKPNRYFYGYIIIVACFLIQGIGVGTITAFGVFFKPLLIEFGWSRATISGAPSLAFLLMGLLGILAGNLNDKFGPRIVVTVTGILYSCGHFFLFYLNSAWQLYLFYGVVVGMGLSSIDVIPLTTIARWFIKRRGMMTGIVKVGTGAGHVIMPLLAGIFIMNFGWRFAFIFIGIIVLVFIIGSGQFLRRDPDQMGQLPDGGAPFNTDHPDSAEKGLSLRDALGSGQFGLFCFINLLAGYCLLTIMVHIVPHATDIGIDSIKSAGVLSTIGGVSIVGRLLIGVAIDRIGNIKSMLICFILLIISFLWLLTADRIWMLYIFGMIYGIAHGGLYTLVSPTTAELFGMASHGVLFGIVAFSVTVGGSVGAMLAGHLFDITHNYHLAFLVLVGVSIAGLLLTFLLKPAIAKKN